jgi:hypothetical protein
VFIEAIAGDVIKEEKMKKLVAIILGILVTFGFAKENLVQKYVYSLPKQTLSSKEIKNLLHMREEEKLARDVYITLYKKWKMPIFKNISKSENWHMRMVKMLLNKYKLKDPIVSDKIGVFSDLKLKRLYEKLVKEGNKSLIDALKVGATIEDLDIYDLDKAIKQTDNRDIKFVYERLRAGSTNHMRAFVGTLKRYGVKYQPKFISKKEYEAILKGSKLIGSFKNSFVEGKVVKVYTLEGLKKGIYWWMADVQTPKGILKVAIAPTWRLKTISIKPNDLVKIRGFKGFYSFIVCSFEDKSSGFKYESNFIRCKK